MCEVPLNLASAGEGLPGGEPLLLQHLAVCQAGLQADVDAFPLRAAAESRSGVCAAVQLESSAAAGATAGAAAEAADSTMSDGIVCSGLPSPSLWAQPLTHTLAALTILLGGDRAVADSTAYAIWLATQLLITHEMATRQPLPQRGYVPAPADVTAPLCMRGPAAEAWQHSLLQFMAGILTEVASEVAAAYLEPTGDGAAAGARSAVADDAASRRCEAAPQVAADDFWRRAAGLGPGPTEQQPTAAAARSDSAAAALMSNAASCVVAINGACHGRKDLWPLLAPVSLTGEAWAKAVANALATAAACLSPGPPDVPAEARIFAFLAADSLSRAALELLQHCVAAGLQAHQQKPAEAGAQLMRALAMHLASDRAVTAPCFEVRCPL
jgi:hypothetical protein